MKLFLVRDTSSENSRFVVLDEYEKTLFTVEGKNAHGVKKLKALTEEGRCVFKISATPEIGGTIGYNVITSDGAFAVTVKLKSSEVYFKIHGAKLFFKGNLFTRSFEITDVSSNTLAFHKPEAGKNGRYSLEIYDDAQTLRLIAVSVCADLISFSDSAAVCRA